MPKYEICIVSKEYRWVEIEAKDHSDAKEKTWDLIIAGYVGDTSPEDTETDLYVEQEIEENENA